MAQVVVNCPFCHAQNIGMGILGLYKTNHVNPHDYAVKQLPNGGVRPIYTHTAISAAVCGKCQKPVGLDFSWKNEQTEEHDSTPDKLCNGRKTADELGVQYTLIAFPPQNTQLKHLPATVEKAFTQAEKNMQMADCEEAAVIMYRRALETAITVQYPAITGRNLKEKIDKLELQHIIPASMKIWAHEIRLIGNDGAHEELGVSRADAEAAQAFTAAFLQYCISLPQEIAQRRGQTASGNNTANTQPAVPVASSPASN